MNPKSSLALLAAALGVFAFIYFVEHPYRLNRERPPDHHILPGFNSALITNLDISPANVPEIQATRAGRGWQLAQPLSYPADTFKIEMLLHTLTNLEWLGTITPAELRGRPKAQEEYGFNPPQFVIAAEGGGQELRLLVGKTSTFGDRVFLEVAGDAAIRVAPTNLLELLPRAPRDWRDPALVDFHAPFDTIKARYGGNRFELQLDTTNRLWRMQKPLEVRADTGKINELLNALAALRVSSFESDDPQGGAESFQDTPASPVLELAFSSANTTLFTLVAGASPAGQTNVVFARREGPTNLVTVAREPLRGWMAGYLNFIDRHLMSTPPSLIQSIEVRGGDQFVLQCQTNDQWTVTQGTETFPAGPQLVQHLLLNFTNVEVEIDQTVAGPAEMQAAGLDHPALEYIVHSAKGGLAHDVTFQFGVGTNGVGAYERRTDEKSINLVGRDRSAFPPQWSWQFRNRRIWNFTPNEVVSVTIEQQGYLLKYSRDEKGQWAIAPAFQGMLIVPSLEEALYRLGQLEAYYWVGRAETNLAQFGFDKTDHRIDLELKQNGRTLTNSISFGGLSARLLPAAFPFASVMLDGQRWVFEFPGPVYEYVLSDLTIKPESRTHPKTP